MATSDEFILPQSPSSASWFNPDMGFNKINIFQRFTNMWGVKQPQWDSDNNLEQNGNVLELHNTDSQTALTQEHHLNLVKETAELIAGDVLLNFDIANPKKPPNNYCKTMRRCVNELSIRHDIVFKGMIKRLNPTEDNFYSTFVIVGDEIFQDGQINWGRIVSVFCFAARILRYHRDSYQSSEDAAHKELYQKMASFVGKYVASKLGQWILDHGGWDAFVRFFPDHVEFEDKLWKGLLFTAIGFGALATMAVSR